VVDTVASALSRAGHFITSVHSPLAGLRDDVRLIAFAAACIRELNPGQLNRLEPLSRAMRKAGLTISAGEYLRALERLRQRAAEIIEALAPFDALVCPVASTAPPPSEPPDQTLERLEADWDWAQFARGRSRPGGCPLPSRRTPGARRTVAARGTVLSRLGPATPA